MRYGGLQTRLARIPMTVHRFVVEGVASPDLPIRVLNLFAQQDLPFARALIEQDSDRYTLSIDHHGLTAGMAKIMVEKMRSMVLVEMAHLHVG